MFKIALDAGHGLYTAGKRCLKAIDPNETREWWLNDRICDKVEKKLASYDGYFFSFPSVPAASAARKPA